MRSRGLQIQRYRAPFKVLRSTGMLRLPRNLHFEVHNRCACHKICVLRFTQRRACHEICTSRFTKCCPARFSKCCTCQEISTSSAQSAAPAAKSATEGAQSAALATKSATEGAQRAVPATKSAHQGPHRAALPMRFAVAGAALCERVTSWMIYGA